jgi:methyl-accepting chemotaxis protein
VRVTLSHKFLVGSLLVTAAVVVFPTLVDQAGVPVEPWVTPFVALGMGALLGFTLSRQMGRHYRSLLRATERISHGDLTARIEMDDPAWLRDESHDLARSIAGMLESLREMVAHVQLTADRVSASAQALSRTAEGVSRGNGEISATVASVAKAVAHQQELVVSTSRLIHDIAKAIEVNSARAREAFGFASEANQKANSGVTVSRIALEKMKSVFERVERCGSMVFDLEAKTRHVDKITEMISYVAERTNLLSLNASIEAARAGEAGRGFSVVADEIRKLAETSGRRADEISKLIHEIQADTREVADGMREASVVISEGREDVNTIATSLEDISGAVGETSVRAEEIFGEADRQARDAERMVESVDEIGRVALANATAVDEVAETTQQQLAAMVEMVGSAQALETLSKELRGVLHRFQTTDAPKEQRG